MEECVCVCAGLRKLRYMEECVCVGAGLRKLRYMEECVCVGPRAEECVSVFDLFHHVWIFYSINV